MATEVGQAYVQIVPSARGIGSSLSAAISPAASSAGTMAGATLGTKLKGALGKVAIGAAVFTAFKKAIQEGAKLQQSIGGVETLFKSSAGQVEKYATNAYKTAGLSANEYMETVTTFSASLLQSLGGNTKKAADQANMAITDMADNSNKMGTSMSSIQYAYQGFAKQNYGMLDNLKLGYGGSKKEMQRLLSDATKLTGVKYNMSNLSDVYSAIHAIQGEIGITGTTSKEAASTFTGSFNSMKSAWSNLLGNMALGNDAGVQQSLTALAGSILTFAKNLIPMLINIIKTGLAALPQVAAMAFRGMMNASAAILSGEGSGKIITAIINWLPKLVVAILQLAAGLLSVIGSIIIKLIAMGYKAVNNFVLGIFQGSGNLISSGMQAVGHFIAGIASKSGSVVASGFKSIGHFIVGLLKGAGKIIATAAVLILKFIDKVLSFDGRVTSAGFKLVISIAAGLLRGLGRVISAGHKIVLAVISAVKSGASKMISVGLNLVKGIWSGISSGLGWIKSKLSGWIGNVTSFIKRVFKIGSPSKLMADEVGQWIPKGIALGINQNTSAVTDAMKGVADITTAGDYMSAVSMPNGRVANYGALANDGNSINYNRLGEAVADAMTGMTVGVDGRQFGRLVRKGAVGAI